jgi:hypothetical protein
MQTNVIDCPACAHELQVPPDLLGQLVRCPLCGKNFTAPRRFEEISGPVAELASSPPKPLSAETVPQEPVVKPRDPRYPRGFRCPYCQTTTPPQTREQISIAGWIVFAAMLFFCFPLFWIGLLMKETYHTCSGCGMRLGGGTSL